MTDVEVAPGRPAAALVGVGALLFMVADLANPVASDVYVADGAAEVQSRIEASEAEWDAWFTLGTVGLLVAALGLWLTGRQVVHVIGSRETGRATAILPWAGAATGAYALLYGWFVVASPESLAEFYGEQSVTALALVAGLPSLAGLAGFLLGMGFTLRRLGHLRWLAWVLLLLGPVSVLVGFAVGPLASYFVLLVMAIALAVRPLARGASQPAA